MRNQATKVRQRPGALVDLNDKFLFDDISRKDYYDEEEKLDIELAIRDMQRVMLFTYEPFVFYLKSIANREIVLEPRTDKDVMRILKSIVIGSETVQIPTGKKTFKTVKNTVSLKTLFDEGEGVEQTKNKFLVKSVRFFSDDPNEFSYFRGYPWEPLEKPDYKIITPWLEHVEQNLCNKNVDVYNYIADWISFIVKNPGQKVTTAPIFIGDHGCGKGDFFAIPLSKLFGKYALKNVTKIDNITGKFNNLLENKVFVVCNEMQSSENSKFLNADSLKSIITDYDIDYESKFVNKRAGECVANLMFFSNHELPIRLENGDRRYVVIKCSNKRCKDFKYFNKLHEVMEHELFYQTLFTWFLNRDIRKRNFRAIPETEAKQDMLEASKESWQHFFDDNINEFVEGDGYVSKDCYADYQTYCQDNGYAPYSLTKFGMKLKRFVDIIPRKREGKVVRFYKINDDGMKVYQKIQKDMEAMEEIESAKEIRERKDKEREKEVKLVCGKK
jgi:hypothetical protein